MGDREVGGGQFYKNFTAIFAKRKRENIGLLVLVVVVDT
jgi:hypothetical protein